MSPPIHTISSPAMVLPVANIDTDQIIPARFLTTTTRQGLGAHAFADWRNASDSPFADARAATARILVAGDNFGCGSSREHAAWALLDAGFHAVVSTSFADIFRNNALKNGVLPIIVPKALHQQLLRASWPEVTIDLDRCECRYGAETVAFPIDVYERDCLRLGRDDFDQLLARLPAIQRHEEASL